MEFQTTLIMLKVKNNLLPDNIQKMFRRRDGSYYLRETLNLLSILHREASLLQSVVLNYGTD